MYASLLTLVVGLLVVVSGLAIIFVLGLRTKSMLLLRPLFWFSKRFMNPRQLRTAGQPGAYASIVRHRGRRTGRPYETPVGVVQAGDDFLITLPYGTKAQWLCNVLAAGEATLVTEGRTHAADRPEIIPMRDVAARFSRADQRLIRVFATTDCLRLRRVASLEEQAHRAA